MTAARPAVVKHVTGAKSVSIQTVARRMFDESNGDLNRATEMMANYVSNMPRLSAELLRIGARTLLNSIPTIDRKAAATARGETETASFVQSVPHRMNDATKAAQVRIRRLGNTSQNAILNDKYTIGSICKPLREWLGTEILEHGQKQMLAGQTAVRNARFLISVGELAGVDKVGDKVDEASAARLKALAYDLS